MKAAALLAILVACLSATAACAGPRNPDLECSPNNGGITLPDGFCAVVVADALGMARHLTVNENGDVYVALSDENNGGGIVALRDTNGDGRADSKQYFGDHTGTGIAIRNGYLYYAPDEGVLRYEMQPGELVPQGKPQTVVQGLPEQNQHAAKSIAFGDQGWLYVNIGAPSNDCQKQDRVPHSPGVFPCSLLKKHGGIWRFKADEAKQSQADGQRFATGIRNAVAIAWNPIDSQLYVVQHGRDQLHDLWPKQYTIEQSAELPAEQFYQVDQGDNFGWPYCYYDWMKHKKVLNPEYQRHSEEIECSKYEQPIMAFPGHWAPDALLFYTGNAFPERYHGGAFIAFHGSWNRAPEPQEGYRVVFVPFKDGKPAGHYETFAHGFKKQEKLAAPDNAEFRPVGLAQGPDGSLYIADSHQGRIWRVIYTGEDKQK